MTVGTAGGGGGGADTKVGENTAVLSPAVSSVKSIPPTYATDSPEGDVVTAVGEELLTKVNVAEAPGATAVPELLIHMMELPLSVLAQPSELEALVGSEGRLSPLVVQPYQKLFRALVPVFCSVTV